MLIFPNCKINIGLSVLRKRADGFHDLETVFYPVSWNDLFEIVQTEPESPALDYKSSGIRLYGPKEKNLCIRAHEIIAASNQIPPVKMHLHKIIPVGAGLGGGSADGAFTLLALNKICKLGLKDEELEKLAAQLGSDCPFFIRNKPVFASGRGNEMEEINLKLKGWYLVIVKPRLHIGTAEAFSGIVPKQPAVSLRTKISLPIQQWKNEIVNDFEQNIFEKHPSIRNIKNKLYQYGATYASMSGSGSAVFGLFPEEKNLKPYFRSCTVWQGKLN